MEMPTNLVCAPLCALSHSWWALDLRLGLRQDSRMFTQCLFPLHAQFSQQLHGPLFQAPAHMHTQVRTGIHLQALQVHCSPHLLAPLAAPLLPLLPNLALCAQLATGPCQLLQAVVHLPAGAAAHQAGDLAGLPAPHLHKGVHASQFQGLGLYLSRAAERLKFKSITAQAALL